MATFRKLCEEMNSRKPGRDFWDKNKQDSVELDQQSMDVIKRGLEIRPDRTDGNTFWDDFISVIANNSDGSSRLLGVSSAIVSRWASKIKEAMDMVREQNASEEDSGEMLNTGEEENSEPKPKS